MVTKYKIKGFDNYRVGEDWKIYKLPYVQGKKHYGFKLVIKQYPNRWRLNGEWVSKNKIEGLLIEDDEPMTIKKASIPLT